MLNQYVAAGYIDTDDIVSCRFRNRQEGRRGVDLASCEIQTDELTDTAPFQIPDAEDLLVGPLAPWRELPLIEQFRC